MMELKPEWIEAWENNPMLHVFAQESHHADAFLLMNEAGRKQLIALLQQEAPVVAAEFMPQDGEGFTLYVATLPTGTMLRAKQQYTDVNAWPNGAVRPLDIPEVRAAILAKVAERDQEAE
jgi:hypothetical protein